MLKKNGIRMDLKFLLKPDLLLIPICILVIGLFPLPTPYYFLVKISVFIFGVAAFFSIPSDYNLEKIVFLVLAIIYNPIFPIYFGTRLIWFPINCFTIYFFWRFRKELISYGEE